MDAALQMRQNRYKFIQHIATPSNPDNSNVIDTEEYQNVTLLLIDSDGTEVNVTDISVGDQAGGGDLATITGFATVNNVRRLNLEGLKHRYLRITTTGAGGSLTIAGLFGGSRDSERYSEATDVSNHICMKA